MKLGRPHRQRHAGLRDDGAAHALADLLREKLGLTGTHLRCEQGACGACTLLIDGQPARSCITYAVLCEGAEITTIEGLDDDPVMAALRRAFTAEHGLQCGYCTPGMLITARDIVMRLPDADERRIRLELSGNLCRCTGYVGIVRAIRRVLEERRLGGLVARRRRARQAWPGRIAACRAGRRHGFGAGCCRIGGEPPPAFGEAGLGLGGKKPNIEIRQSFVDRATAAGGVGFPGRRGAGRPLHARGNADRLAAATDCRAGWPSSLGRSPRHSMARRALSATRRRSAG